MQFETKPLRKKNTFRLSSKAIGMVWLFISNEIKPSLFLLQMLLVSCLKLGFVCMFFFSLLLSKFWCVYIIHLFAMKWSIGLENFVLKGFNDIYKWIIIFGIPLTYVCFDIWLFFSIFSFCYHKFQKNIFLKNQKWQSKDIPLNWSNGT